MKWNDSTKLSFSVLVISMVKIFSVIWSKNSQKSNVHSYILWNEMEPRKSSFSVCRGTQLAFYGQNIIRYVIEELRKVKCAFIYFVKWNDFAKIYFSVWDTPPAFYGHNLLLPAPRGFIRHHKHTKICCAKAFIWFCLLSYNFDIRRIHSDSF